MIPRCAVVLIAHGSPDPQWAAPLRALQKRLQQLLPDERVELAFLDFNDPTLDACCAELVGAGHTQIRVFAAFMSAGGKHLRRDVPDAVERVAANHAGIAIELDPGALGADDAVVEALAVAALRRLATTR